MAKLYFRYGAMGSSKTLNLLSVAHNYKEKNKGVFIFKPEIDTRFGSKNVESRSGLKSEADIVFKKNDNVFDIFLKENSKREQKVSCVLVDEAQFFTKKQIESLRDIASSANIPVICYGLRTDFLGNLFSGSKRLFELSDSIEEIKTICFYCTKKAIMNMRISNGYACYEGPKIQLGGDDSYVPVCYNHYIKEIEYSKLSKK